MSLSLLLGLAGITSFIPSAEAASSSASARVIKKLKKQIRTLQAQLAAARAVPPPPAPFIEMVTVGNVGNAPDQDFGEGAFGAVSYEFQIGKTEVTLAQCAAFLNAVAATDTHNLYNLNLETNLNIAGISRSGSSGNFTYSVIGTATRPVTFVSWFDAARFCNWLHNGRPGGSQIASTTERGAYTLGGATSGGLTITRNPGAKFWIPSENECYKAAYHQPARGGLGQLLALSEPEQYGARKRDRSLALGEPWQHRCQFDFVRDTGSGDRFFPKLPDRSGFVSGQREFLRHG